MSPALFPWGSHLPLPDKMFGETVVRTLSGSEWHCTLQVPGFQKESNLSVKVID